MNFFTSVGSKISESVRPTAVDPISLMPDYPQLNNLVLSNIGPNRLCEIIKTFESKSSCDLDNISTKLLKHVITDLSSPLAHIFNLSIFLASFPLSLKLAEQFLSSRWVLHCYVIIIGQPLC